jgi:hypothetical protein
VGTHGELGAPGADAELIIVVCLDRHCARFQRPHNVGNEPSGRDHDTIRGTDHSRLDLDGQIQIRPRQPQLIAEDIESYARQDWEGAAPAGDGSASGREGVKQDVTLASKLHWLPSLKP